MSILSVLVAGSGLMGGGIAQVCAQAGISVFLYDISAKAIGRALKQIAWSSGKLIEKGELAQTVETILGRITPCRSIGDAGNVDIAIEAVFEDINVKKEVFEQLDSSLAPDTLIASNTSSIPITELASHTSRPEKILGLHFFSPVPLMMAVEVVSGMLTSDETARIGKAFVEQIGKTPIMVKKDVAGFVINRINLPATIEAIRLVEQGIATIEDIDKGLRLASGRKMGIFETGDMVGLDVTYGALMAMYNETGDPRWYPPRLLRRKVRAGHLGRKTGKGWYVYTTGKKTAPE